MPERSRKKLLIAGAGGTALVLIPVLLLWSGSLDRIETVLRDLRVQHCQGAEPPADPSIAHLDVDDDALKYIGRWPWPRRTMGRIIDEVALAKPKVLAMDVLFADAGSPALARNDRVGVDDDQLLAAAMQRVGCCLLPVSLSFHAGEPQSRLRALVVPLLTDHPERAEAECVDLLRDKGVTAADFDRDPADSFAQLRAAAFVERIWRELSAHGNAPPDRAMIRRAMLPGDSQFTGSTVLGRLFDEEYDLVARQQAMQRFTAPVPADAPPLVVASDEIAPIVPLARAAAFSGFTDFLPESADGTVQSIPLMARYRGRMVPQVSLAAACAVLGVDPRTIRIARDTVTIPRPGGRDVVMPVTVRDSTVGSVGTVMEIPLFGRPDDWPTLYDVPRHERPARHVSVTDVWDACQNCERLNHDGAAATQLLVRALIAMNDIDGAAEVRASPPEGAAKRKRIGETLASMADLVQGLGPDPSALDVDARKMLANVRATSASLRLAVKQIDKLERQLADQRAALRESLGGRAIFFGGTATSVGDEQPTSLFRRCPGVVIQSAVCNAILTGKTWRLAPRAWGVAITTMSGLLTLFLTTRLSPGKAFLASLALAVGYLAFNGYVLFARLDLIIPAAGPTIAVAFVWAGTSLARHMAAYKSLIAARTGRAVPIS